MGNQTQTERTTNLNSNINDDDNLNRTKNMFLFCYKLYAVEQEIMEFYTKQFGYDPREPQTYYSFQRKRP